MNDKTDTISELTMWKLCYWNLRYIINYQYKTNKLYVYNI
jgi:hypothetical protein